MKMNKWWSLKLNRTEWSHMNWWTKIRVWIWLRRCERIIKREMLLRGYKK